MDNNKLFKSLQYVPKIWTAFTMPILLFISLYLFFGKNFNNLKIDAILNILPDFYNHISNFSIAFTLYITIGYVGVMLGVTVKHLAVIGLFFLFVSLFIELFIPFLNTPDNIDAIFGIFGVMVAFVVLFLVKKYGLKKNEL